MLKLTILGDELYDEAAEEFVTKGDVTLELEHSLVSLSKWEQIFEKPFLSEDNKTNEEVLKYIELMILTPIFPPEVLSKLSKDDYSQIDAYINKRMTATWFREDSEPRSQEVVTAELIYYWLVSFRIPWECQNWHLSSLFTLIRVLSVKNGKPKKMTREQVASQFQSLNAKRRSQTGSSG